MTQPNPSPGPMPPLPPSWNPYTVGLTLIGAAMVLTMATAAGDLAASVLVFLAVAWAGATLLIGRHLRKATR